ncbi:MAG: glutathione peroxidase [Rhodospirillaceae bacterium]|nr:glutathione peroxidase [Rhodospirillaceae bacterium]
MRFFAFFLAFLGWASAEAREQIGSAHQFTFKSISGQTIPLSSFQGQVILVVNTASHCGFTSQYQSLQTLWERYKKKGLVVLAVPSGDFGSQEFASNQEIKEFCDINYGRTFPMTEKTSVVGNGSHPFFAWALKNTGVWAKPRWNFHKFLVDGNGKMVDWFSSPTDPLSKNVIQAVEKQLGRLSNMTAPH